MHQEISLDIRKFYACVFRPVIKISTRMLFKQNSRELMVKFIDLRNESKRLSGRIALAGLQV